ncbi:MAG: NUDIX domain-containing protein [Gammaproteobacteria bacterium AqS3]|nr:NUDIX domain-containing protein [Gammaproteobacteria bacterium AqS3]
MSFDDEKALETEHGLIDTLDLPLLKSAGGLVCNDAQHILLIFKRGKWDMPKGRVEISSDYEQEAMREVSEETGLLPDKLSITGTLPPTWHVTLYQGRHHLKKTTWYLMHYRGDDDDVVPQIEEDIIECRWICLSDLPQYRELMRHRINYVIDFWHSNLAYSGRALSRG